MCYHLIIVSCVIMLLSFQIYRIIVLCVIMPFLSRLFVVVVPLVACFFLLVIVVSLNISYRLSFICTVIFVYIFLRYLFVSPLAARFFAAHSELSHIYIYIYTLTIITETMRDKDLYTTTNKCLQCLIKIMYTVF